MAVQPFIQFIFGCPKINVEFGAHDFDSSRILACFLYNRPIDNWFLKRLGVHRMTADDIFTVYSIENIRTQRSVAENVIPVIATVRDGERLEISLPSSSTPATVTLIRALKSGETNIEGKGRESD